MPPSDSATRRVEPRVPRGFQDHLPEAAAARLHVMDTVRRVYATHGFVPLATPAVEMLECLVGPGGDEASRSIFRVEAGEDDALGLRFDLTVPTARVVAAHQQDLPRPFRRYQVGSVWRLDKPGPGRFREFVQCDADIVGTTSHVADAEILAAFCEAFRALLPAASGSPPKHRIRLSDRRLLDALTDHARIPRERSADLLRVIDKLDRLGREKVRLELTAGYTDESGDRIEGLGFPEESVAQVLEFVAMAAPTRSETLDRVARFFGSGPGVEAVAAVSALSELLHAFGISDAELAVDVAIARGLAYYTGPVFEAVLHGADSFGSVGGGGRYDDLVSRFSGQAWPGVGASIGVDRLVAALEHAGRADAPGAHAQVLVTAMDGTRLPEYVRMVLELRHAGYSTELYCGTSSGFGKQMKHADKGGFAVAVIAGGDEFAKGVVTVKRMQEPAFDSDASREAWLAQRLGQREVPRAGLVAAVAEALAASGSP